LEALGVVLAIGIGLAVLLGLAFFGFVIWFIFSVFMKIRKDSAQFDRNWTNRR